MIHNTNIYFTKEKLYYIYRMLCTVFWCETFKCNLKYAGMEEQVFACDIYFSSILLWVKIISRQISGQSGAVIWMWKHAPRFHTEWSNIQTFCLFTVVKAVIHHSFKTAHMVGCKSVVLLKKICFAWSFTCVMKLVCVNTQNCFCIYWFKSILEVVFFF